MYGVIYFLFYRFLLGILMGYDVNLKIVGVFFVVRWKNVFLKSIGCIIMYKL